MKPIGEILTRWSDILWRDPSPLIRYSRYSLEAPPPSLPPPPLNWLLQLFLERQFPCLFNTLAIIVVLSLATNQRTCVTLSGDQSQNTPRNQCRNQNPPRTSLRRTGTSTGRGKRTVARRITAATAPVARPLKSNQERWRSLRISWTRYWPQLASWGRGRVATCASA